MSIVDGIDKMEEQAEKGICPLCKETEDKTVQLEEVKVRKNGRTEVSASCPECSFKTWRNHDKSETGEQ